MRPPGFESWKSQPGTAERSEAARPDRLPSVQIPVGALIPRYARPSLADRPSQKLRFCSVPVGALPAVVSPNTSVRSVSVLDPASLAQLPTDPLVSIASQLSRDEHRESHGVRRSFASAQFRSTSSIDGRLVPLGELPVGVLARVSSQGSGDERRESPGAFCEVVANIVSDGSERPAAPVNVRDEQMRPPRCEFCQWRPGTAQCQPLRCYRSPK